MAPYVRKVKTSSGATAVQIVEKRSGVRRIVEHLGSAHDDLELALLLQVARDKLAAGQDELDLGLPPASVGGAPAARVVSSSSRLLWKVLADGYAHLGFDVLADEAFEALVLARLIEPTSKADTVRVLQEIGAPTPHVNTLHAAMARARDRDYRGRLATACMAHSAATTGTGALILYDVTTLHFEVADEDDLRRVGMSKEHRVDPQVQVGLLVDPAGFPLQIHMFEGNKAETTTLIPVLTEFAQRHHITAMVVVADAGMLSASNLNQLEDAGFSFIVGSRLVKAPYDLADHFERHGNYFTDGQILESAREMGTGKNARQRRVIYQWKFKRQKHDDRTINLMIAKAEKIAAGTTAMRKARFLKVTGATKELDQVTIERARQLAGLKGYVTNLTLEQMPGQGVIDAYHDLWQVERSFRMTKSDLRARPIFHHQREAIEAHLTIVFAALAVARHLQEVTGVTIKKLVQTLRPLRSVVIAIGDQTIPADPTPGPDARTILDRLPPITLGH